MLFLGIFISLDSLKYGGGDLILSEGMFSKLSILKSDGLTVGSSDIIYLRNHFKKSILVSISIVISKFGVRKMIIEFFRNFRRVVSTIQKLLVGFSVDSDINIYVETVI